MTFKNLKDIMPIPTSHGCGEKRILASNEETVSAITQIAETTLREGETTDMHMHESMEEFFYILEGEVEMICEKEKIIFERDDFISIKPQKRHRLKAVTDCRILTIGCAIEKTI